VTGLPTTGSWKRKRNYCAVNTQTGGKEKRGSFYNPKGHGLQGMGKGGDGHVKENKKKEATSFAQLVKGEGKKSM